MSKKVTLVLPEETASRLKRAVEEGIAVSQASIVHEAVTEYFTRLSREKRARLWKQAAEDPEFLKDMDAIRSDFRYADEDPLPG